MCVIYTELAQYLQTPGIVHILGDRLFTDGLCDLDNGSHHGLINGIIGDVFNKAPLDLDVINGKALDVGEGAESCTKVIERKLASHIHQLLHVPTGIVQVANRHLLRDLENHGRRRQTICLQALLHAPHQMRILEDVP